MGACLCKGHKELHYPMTVRQDQTVEGQPSSVEDGQNPSNGSVADKTSGYDIGQLATSSLMGVVATIKEHITKPTTLAQGRVAHLIEWKGWVEEARVGGAWANGPAGGSGGAVRPGRGSHECVVDDDGLEQPSTSLQATPQPFLSQFLLDGGSLSVPHSTVPHSTPRLMATTGGPTSSFPQRWTPFPRRPTATQDRDRPCTWTEHCHCRGLPSDTWTAAHCPRIDVFYN
ncbi:hypothetical protein KUCAC02_013008 [Chaenocephalus aceratus]|uniref:Uncharacterized protein n=1 Tax=Chaenocephalus aceratus TaxID=36190 RepID=A0ACB9XDF9_CHAAC|nr:hypothetical protein KUCAC02_013008 [Chaenocephalus aceratus]